MSKTLRSHLVGTGPVEVLNLSFDPCAGRTGGARQRLFPVGQPIDKRPLFGRTLDNRLQRWEQTFMISMSPEFRGNFRHHTGGWLSADISMLGSVIATDALAWGVNRPGNVRCVYDSDGLRMQAELPAVINKEPQSETYARLQHWLTDECPAEHHADRSWQAWLIDSVPRATLDGDRGRISSAVAGDLEIQVCPAADQLQLSIELQPVAPLTGICQAALAEFLWAAHSRFRMVRAELDTHARLVSRLDFDQLETMCPIAIKQLQTSARRIRKTVETLTQEHVAVAYLER